jgi:hypothetical protein
MHMKIARLFAAFAMVCCAFSIAAAATPSWLDAKPTAGWNAAGSAIPKAPAAIDPETLKRCGTQLREAATPEDRTVIAAGWRLFESYRAFNATSVVVGLSGFDGMCRPAGYQAFVFSNGTFAGTLSPLPMNSRSDGAIEHLELFGADRIVAAFARYKESDPLCCASATSYVTFGIDGAPRSARVTVRDVSTEPNGSH